MNRCFACEKRVEKSQDLEVEKGISKPFFNDKKSVFKAFGLTNSNFLNNK